MKTLISLLINIRIYGLKGIYAFFFPVYRAQDLSWKNNGYDLIKIKKPEKGTFGWYTKKRVRYNHMK